MKKIIRSISVKAQYVYQALRKINRPHIGDLVEYKGEKCSLIQGVANPRWDLLPMSEKNLAKDKRDIYKGIHKDEFKLQPLIRRFVFSFLFTYEFYMGYWYSIDMDRTGRIMFIQN